MTVRVLFFSVLKDIAGTDELSLSVPSDARVSDVLDDVFQRWPKLKEWDTSLLTAVDQTYSKRDGVLHEDAEIAIMPPVQGG